jgi:hypothetical protein
MGDELPPPYIGRHVRRVLAVECVVCHRISGGHWRGWAAYRIDEPGTDEQPELAFYCPDCRRAQFSHG